MTYLKITSSGCAPSYFAIASDHSSVYCYNNFCGAFRYKHTMREMQDAIRAEGFEVVVDPVTAAEAITAFSNRKAWFKEAEFAEFCKAMADEYCLVCEKGENR